MAARLLLLAHPDDEFAAFPHIERYTGVQVAWLTDGGWGGQDTELRKRESVAVLAHLGVRPEHLHFLGHLWDVPDGYLYRHLEWVVPKLVDYFGSLAAGAEVLVPAWEGGHQDHDAAHLAGLALAAAGAHRVRQFSLYNGYGLPSSFFRVLCPLAANGHAEVQPTPFVRRLQYIRRCFGYRSQWRSFCGLLPFYALRMLHADAFCLQDARPERTATRPHPGKLLYERRGGPTWETFAAATAQFRVSHSGGEPAAGG